LDSNNSTAVITWQITKHYQDILNQRFSLVLQPAFKGRFALSAIIRQAQPLRSMPQEIGAFSVSSSVCLLSRFVKVTV
jgi:hypothetical protein